MKKTTAVIISAILMLTMLPCMVSAEELPVKQATKDGATVSEKVETATNKKPDMGTQMYMYLEPDAIVNDYPQMGDEGIPVKYLLTGAILSGAGYLITTIYAHTGKRTSLA